MIINKKTITKLTRFIEIYKGQIYTTLTEITMEGGKTLDHYRTCPDRELAWKAITPGEIWGEPWQSMWLRGNFIIPSDYKGGKLYIQAETGAVEVLVIVDKEYKGILNIETEEGVRGHHHTRLALAKPQPGSEHALFLECYAGHPCVGTQPFDPRTAGVANPETYRRTFRFVRLVTKRQNVSDFVTELRILLQIAELTGTDSFRGARIYKGLVGIFEFLPQQPSDYSSEEVDVLINRAREIMKPLLAMKNGCSAPTVGIIGHSHMDTAWLWTVNETIRKCARTFSNTLNLMEEYADYKFLLSAPYHLEMMKEEYPSIFRGIKKRIKEGRLEPNGGSWVEPDCNIPSGESLTRHFLYGQKFLEENFNYRADTFWQPDVFGYSASIPQILQQCGIRNFLTTKLSWNEDNRFPYDTFHWHGIDGSSVLTHFNTTHNWPDPQSLITQTRDIQHKDIQTSRYCSFGYGDGGGGPLYEMLETAPYMKDIEGVPKTEYAFVSDFMKELGQEKDLPRWKGELYLELHRGTLTSLHNIKKMNRNIEILIREGEFLSSVLCTRDGQSSYPKTEWETYWKRLLKNQFHDILPGTSITPVNETAIEELQWLESQVKDLIKKTGSLSDTQDSSCYRIWNSRGWQRSGTMVLEGIPSGLSPSDGRVLWQRITTVSGQEQLVVDGLTLPGLGSTVLALTDKTKSPMESTPFYSYGGNKLETAFFTLLFGKKGEIISLWDKMGKRELVAKGEAFGLQLGEDLPAMWDNWDIDVDQKMKMELLVAQEAWTIVQEGPLQIRLANRFLTRAGSLIEQHIVLYKDQRQIEFDNHIDWKETHKLLKAYFPMDIQTDRAKFEIQYGHLERGTNDNLPQDRSQFEACNHEWTDLSEEGYGVSLINDSSYGISVRGSVMGLSLLKSGTHPDPAADRGVHTLRYALRPHEGGFSTKSTLRPAREFNTPLTALPVKVDSPVIEPLLKIESDNIILESVKEAEDGNGSIARLFESEKKRTLSTLLFGKRPAEVWECNMLEENNVPLNVENDGSIKLNFHGFQVKTLRLIW